MVEHRCWLNTEMIPTLTLKSIEEEAADCRAAWADSKVGDIGIHIHHSLVCEVLLEPVENRIEYILREKPNSEQALRLRLMRPLRQTPPDLRKAYAEWNKANAEWNKANAEWHKASAEWNKADAEWDKANAEWTRAARQPSRQPARVDKASAEWDKAERRVAQGRRRVAQGRVAEAEYKASAEWGKASAEWGKAHHASNCVPGCTWNGRTIFP